MKAKTQSQESPWDFKNELGERSFFFLLAREYEWPLPYAEAQGPRVGRKSPCDDETSSNPQGPWVVLVSAAFHIFYNLLQEPSD